MSFIKLISLLFYNPKVCFSDLAPNIIYSKTDECCPITYSSTWTVIEFCLRTLMHCLNKPDGALKHFSRTVTRHCVCEADSQVKRELWTTSYPSAGDSWKVRIWFSLNLFCICGVTCHVTYRSKENQDLCVWERKLFRNLQVKSNLSTPKPQKGEVNRTWFIMILRVAPIYSFPFQLSNVNCSDSHGFSSGLSIATLKAAGLNCVQTPTLSIFSERVIDTVNYKCY